MVQAESPATTGSWPETGFEEMRRQASFDETTFFPRDFWTVSWDEAEVSPPLNKNTRTFAARSWREISVSTDVNAREPCLLCDSERIRAPSVNLTGRRYALLSLKVRQGMWDWLGAFVRTLVMQ